MHARHKNLYANVYSNFIYNHSKLDKPNNLQLMNEWTNDSASIQWFLYLSSKKEQTTSMCNHMDAFQMHYAKVRKPDSKIST